MSKGIGFAQLFFVCLITVGCASQKNVALHDGFWQEDRTVVVAMAEAPDAKLYKAGAQGILDHAVNETIANKLNKHLKTTDLGWYTQLSQKFANDLKARGINAKPHEAEIDRATAKKPKKYRYLADETDADTILLLRLDSVGAIRNYYGMIPLNSPRGLSQITGELVDANSGKVLWRYKSTVEQSVYGKWSEPPDYGNLSKALSVAMKSSREDLHGNLFVTD